MVDFLLQQKRIDRNKKESSSQTCCLWPTPEAATQILAQKRAGSSERPSRCLIAATTTYEAYQSSWRLHRSRRPRWTSPPLATRCEAVSHQSVGCGRWRRRKVRTHPDHIRGPADCISIQLGLLSITSAIKETTSASVTRSPFMPQSGDGGSLLHIARHANPSCMLEMKAS